MKIKNFRILCLSVGIIFFGIGMVFANEPTGAIKLGLDLATATADQKSLTEGLKKVGQDKLDEWMWDSIGGYEMLLRSRSEASIPGAKDKLKQIVETVQSIEKFAIAIAEGKYDDALFTAIDQTVNLVNHPLVSVTWAACKLTYESHKLVQETKAALDIERLYGYLASDRRLMGEGGSKDAPPQLLENSATVDYFFDKYVITDAAARGMFRSYVEKEIGEEWPEESWGDWAKSWMAIGSGVNTGEAAETVLLAGAWRNKARTWIMLLIKDVNNQAKVAWAQARARQYLAEFQAFSKRVGHFYNNDFEQMVKEFESIRKHQEALPQYRSALAESQKERPLIKEKINSKSYLKEKDGAKTINEALSQWVSQTYSISLGASIGGDEKLAQTLMDESKAWRQMRDEFSKEVETKKEDILQDQTEKALDVPSVPYGMMRWNNLYPRMEAAAKTLYAKYFEKVIVPFDFDSQSLDFQDKQGVAYRIEGNPESLKKAMTDFLNEGRFDLASALLNAFDNALSASYSVYHRQMEATTKENLQTPIEVTEALQTYKEIYAAAEAKMAPLSQAMGAISVRAHDEYAKCRDGYYECQRIFDRIRPQILGIQGQINALWESTYPSLDHHYVQERGWLFASTAGAANIKTVQALDGIVMNQTRAALLELYNVFDSLRQSRKEQYGKYQAAINQWNEFFQKDLSYVESWSKETEERLQKLKDNAHTYLVPRNSPEGSLVGLAGLLEGLGNSLSSGTEPLGSLDVFESMLQQSERKLEELQAGWKSLPVLSSAEILQIQVLVEPSFDYVSAKKRIDQESPKLKNFAQKIRTLINQFDKLSDTDANNRAKDSSLLYQHSKKVQGFINHMLSQKIMKYTDGDYRIDVHIDPTTKMIILEKPYNHYAREAEIKQITTPVKSAWTAAGSDSFVSKYFPSYATAIQKIINLSDVVAAKDDNFLMSTSEVIYAGDITKANSLVTSLKPSSDSFDAVMRQVASLLPRVLNVRTDAENQKMEATAKNLYKVSLEEYMQVMRIPAESFTLREGALGFGPSEDHAIGKAYREAVKKIEVLTQERRGYLQMKAQEEWKKQYAQEEAERQKQWESEQKQQAISTLARGLADYYGYYVIDPRINSYSLANAHGEVILTRDEIQQDTYELSGRMSTLQRIEKMLISVDGGRGWNELPVSDVFSYTFTPMPDVPYQFLMRIKTMDQEDITFEMMPGVESVTYQNISFKDLLLQTIKALADAYERADAIEFSNYISREYLGQRVFLEEGIRFDFDMFTDIRLTIYVNRIDIRSNRYVLETSWQKTQMPRKTGEQQRTSGRTTFTFVLEDGMMKILNLKGDLLYATLSPEIAQASGLSSSIVDAIRVARDEQNPIQPGAGSTQESGGLDEGGDVLPFYTASLSSIGSQYFVFHLGRVEPDGDLILGGDYMTITGPGEIQEEIGKDFHSVHEALEAGVEGATAVEGRTYTFKTYMGYYGKMEVLSFRFLDESGIEGEMTFRYAIQMDGSTNVRTK